VGAFDYLKVRPFQRATSMWANSLVDAINTVYDMGSSTVKYSDLAHLGYDIIPDKDNARRLGDPSRAWRDINAHYGYFKDGLFVQGKAVIKDGDPVNIYDIFPPAEGKIVEAVNESRATAYLKDIRDKAVKVSIDAYGNVGVIIAEPVDEYGRVRTSVEDAFRPVGDRVALPAAQNTYGASVSILSGGRPNVNVYYSLGGAGTIYVEVSLDGSKWRVLDTITLTAAGSGLKTYAGVAYPYVRVRTPTTGVDVELEVVASR